MGRAQADAFILDVVRRMPDGEKNYQLYKEVLPTIDQAAMTKIVDRSWSLVLAYLCFQHGRRENRRR